MKIFSLFQNVQPAPAAKPASYSLGPGFLSRCGLVVAWSSPVISNYYYYYYYYMICVSLFTDLFFLVLLLNQRWSPPLRPQASHCSTFRTMCDVPSTSVFCSESIECFPFTVSKFFLKLLVTFPVDLIITGIIVHFRFPNAYSLKCSKRLYVWIYILRAWRWLFRSRNM